MRRLVTMLQLHRDDIDETVAASMAREALRKQRAEMRAAAERGELSSYMGGLNKGDASQASLGQRSMRSFATNRSRQVQGWGFANEAESPAMKISEYVVGALWVVLHRQLTEAAKAAKAKEMYCKEDELSWWGVKMHAETTSAAPHGRPGGGRAAPGGAPRRPDLPRDRGPQDDGRQRALEPLARQPARGGRGGGVRSSAGSSWRSWRT